MAQGEWQATSNLIDASIRILSEQFPMTIRQLFYQLVSIAVIDNCLRDYKRVSRAMTIARRDERVDYEWIVDRSRPVYESNKWDDLAQFGRAMQRSLKGYRRDRWQDQPIHCSLICEKDAMTGSLEPVREEYGLTLRALRGFDSTTGVRSVAEEFAEANEAGKSVVVLYMGDWDPSGECMDRELSGRIQAEMEKLIDDPDLTVRRIAIFKEDIRTFRLPPMKVKEKDSRSARFVRKHGKRAVEVDALPVNELRSRLRLEIESLIERGAWERAAIVEEAQRATCERYADALTELR